MSNNIVSQHNRKHTVSVVMIVKNEAENLKISLPAVADWVDEIIILDSGSTDESKGIAEQYGAKWFVNTDWPGFGKQRQLAQSYASGDWILALDADEEVSVDLKKNILEIIETKPSLRVYGFKRLDYIFDHCIDNPYWGVKSHWRLHPHTFHYDDNLVHESVVLDNAKTETLNGFLIHHTAPTPLFWLEKRLSYALAWATERHEKGKRGSIHKVILNPLWAFIKQYFIDGRFLQGKYGFVYSLLFVQYTFNKYAILYDLTHNKAKRAFDEENKLNIDLPQLDISKKKTSLSLVMIVKNEARHLSACLETIYDLTDEIIILDSGSTDQTRAISEKYKSKFYINTEWQGFGKQRQIAQKYANSDYILVLDADERVDAQLRESILDVLSQPLQTDKVFSLARVNQFCGVEALNRHWYTDKIARLYANKHFSYSDLNVHESLNQNGVKSHTLNGYLIHLTNDNLHHFLVKNIRYSNDWAQEKYTLNKKVLFLSIPFRSLFTFIRECIFRGALLGKLYGLIFSISTSNYTFNKYLILWQKNNKP